MRLIDANELKERLRKQSLCSNREWLQMDLDLVIDNAPTVEERPQGEWIKTDGNSFECPFCHRLFDFGDNYCGFCGADMRKDIAV